jgi:cell division protein FtsL
MAAEKNKEKETTAVQKIDWKKWLNYQWVVRNIPFFLFLSVLAVTYIYNGHYADKLSRKISVTEKHIKDQEYEYKTIKSDVIGLSKASTLTKVVATMGLKEMKLPPVLLVDSAK